VARVLSLDGGTAVEDAVEGPLSEADDLGRRLAASLHDRGARPLVAAR
jgi:hypothetical protein